MNKEITPVEMGKLIYGDADTSKMDWKEAKARNEVAKNFIKFFNIKIRIK